LDLDLDFDLERASVMQVWPVADLISRNFRPSRFQQKPGFDETCGKSVELFGCPFWPDGKSFRFAVLEEKKISKFLGLSVDTMPESEMPQRKKPAVEGSPLPCSSETDSDNPPSSDNPVLSSSTYTRAFSRENSTGTAVYVPLIERIKQNIALGNKFFSFEFFPPKTPAAAANLLAR
jgi:hypothetical protein